VGTSGSGKTYAAKGLLETVMQQGGRVCVVDPLGVWWGLGKGANGEPPPFPVTVFGGDHADVPLQLVTAVALGRLVATQRLACVVDVSALGTAAVRRQFMTLFTAALYEGNTEPLHLVLDEADLWAPQRAQPDGGELLGRVEEIVCRGRVRGFVPWLITQRPAVLHKDVLSQADVLVSMKLTSS
jgi:DNA helicase HerA-like ATPase